MNTQCNNKNFASAARQNYLLFVCKCIPLTTRSCLRFTLQSGWMAGKEWRL
jgi:hypothetical protein